MAKSVGRARLALTCAWVARSTWKSWACKNCPDWLHSFRPSGQQLATMIVPHVGDPELQSQDHEASDDVLTRAREYHLPHRR
eukprot:6490627-Amphidinium_carterae.1